VSLRFAWPQFRDEWDLEIQLVEPKRDDQDLIDPSARRVRLDQAGDWSIATFAFHAQTTEKAPDGLGDDLDAFVLISSARTNTRLPVRLERSEAGFRGEVTLDRNLLSGAVEVVAQITTRDPVRVVGNTLAWTVVVDASAAPRPPGAPPFETSWDDFTSVDAPQIARASRGSYAVMDLTGANAVLRLNKKIKGFEALLGSTKAQLERRRLRDTIGTGIARYALSTLFREACVRIDVDGAGAVTPPEDPLLRQVLDAVASQVASVGSPEEFYERVAQIKELTILDRGRLWAEIDAALDSLTHHGEYVAGAVEEVRHG
jgi:hypothetical protein